MPPIESETTTRVLFGAGGHAESVADVLASVGLRVVALVVASKDAASHAGATAPVMTEADFAASEEVSSTPVIVAIGSCGVRLAVHRALAQGAAAAAAVAASATVAASAEIGRGTVVHHHAHVGPGARVGEAVIVNTGAIVEHGCTVADGAHLAPGAVLLGDAAVGEKAFIGSGARVLPGVTVESGAVVGAGAVVTRDVPAGATVAGVPARTIGRAREDEEKNDD